MKKIIENLGIPSYLALCTDSGTSEVNSPGCRTALGDITIDCQTENGQLAVCITAGHTPVRWLKLRWEMQWPKKVRFLGDAWERGYGDL